MASSVSPSSGGAPSPKLGPAQRAAAALAGAPVALGKASAVRARDADNAYADKKPKSELQQHNEQVKKEREKNVFSERETKASRYTRRLQEGLNPTGECHIPGILAETDVGGEALLPYEHQRQACSMACVRGTEYVVLAHDAGTGKTATLFQILAAMELCVGGGATAIVTVPPATLPQWEQTAHDWLNLPNKHTAILCTNKAEKVTKSALEKVRVLVITRHLLARLYKSCWEYVKEHHQNGRGNWVGAWQLKPGQPIHPLFTKKWTLMGVDEAYVFSYRTLSLRAHPTPPHWPHRLHGIQYIAAGQFGTQFQILSRILGEEVGQIKAVLHVHLVVRVVLVAWDDVAYLPHGSIRSPGCVFAVVIPRHPRLEG